MKFLIQYGNPPGVTKGKLWYGRGWHPYASKSSAVRLHSRKQAEERLKILRDLWDKNPSFARYLIDDAQIVETEK
jgi:hypothetical protein